MESLREFLLQSSFHGLQYLARGGPSSSAAERAAWAALTATAMAAAAHFVLLDNRENSENPYVTSISFVPVEKVPFPAVSIYNTPTVKGNDPWTDFATGVLDNVLFDCAGRDESCDEATQKVRDLLDKWIRKAVIDNFEPFKHNFHLDDGDIKNLRRICLMSTRIMGHQRGYGFLQSFVSLLGNGTISTQESMELAGDIFRLSSHKATARASTFLLRFNMTLEKGSMRDCSDSLLASNGDTLSTVFGFLASQGNPHYSLPLGQLLKVQLRGSRMNPERLVGMVNETLLKNLAVPAMYVHMYLAGLPRTGFMTPREQILNKKRCEIFWKNVSYNCHSISTTVPDHDYCCKVRNSFKDMYKEALRVMGYVGSWISHHMREKGPHTDFREALNYLDYPLLSNSDSYFMMNQPIVIASHFFGRENYSHEDFCPFSKSYSNKGIAYTFNSAPFWDIYKKSPSMLDFHAMNKKSPEACASARAEQMPLYPLESGAHHRFQFLIKPSQGGSSIALHSPKTLPDLSRHSLRVLPGHTYTVTVTSSMNEVNGKMRKKDMEGLECFSGESSDLALFKEYSQSACLLECRLRRAYKACGCLSWRYPNLVPGALVCPTILDLGGKFSPGCFEQHMTGSKVKGEDCSCPMDCNVVHYNYNVDSQATQTLTECSFQSTWEDMGLRDDSWLANDFFVPQKPGDTAAHIIRQFPAKACRHELPKLALVQVYVAPTVVSVSTTSLRATFADRVANVGGVLGLFTGMSLLSIAELVVWAVKIVGEIFGERHRILQRN